jgi:hypothetical protein
MPQLLVPPSQVEARRSPLLVLARPPLDLMAFDDGRRPTRYRHPLAPHRLAPHRLAALPGLEESPPRPGVRPHLRWL